MDTLYGKKYLDVIGSLMCVKKKASVGFRQGLLIYKMASWEWICFSHHGFGIKNDGILKLLANFWVFPIFGCLIGRKSVGFPHFSSPGHKSKGRKLEQSSVKKGMMEIGKS